MELVGQLSEYNVCKHEDLSSTYKLEDKDVMKTMVDEDSIKMKEKKSKGRGEGGQG